MFYCIGTKLNLSNYHKYVCEELKTFYSSDKFKVCTIKFYKGTFFQFEKQGDFIMYSNDDREIPLDHIELSIDNPYENLAFVVSNSFFCDQCNTLRVGYAGECPECLYSSSFKVDDRCPICLEDLDCGAVFKTECGHHMHTACERQIKPMDEHKWLTNYDYPYHDDYRECPMCRGVYDSGANQIGS